MMLLSPFVTTLSGEEAKDIFLFPFTIVTGYFVLETLFPDFAHSEADGGDASPFVSAKQQIFIAKTAQKIKENRANRLLFFNENTFFKRYFQFG